jgi:hypothetical protein
MSSGPTAVSLALLSTLYHYLLLDYCTYIGAPIGPVAQNTCSYNWLKVNFYGSATSLFARNTSVATIVIANTLVKYSTDITV